MLRHTWNIFLFILVFCTNVNLSFGQTDPLEIWQIQGQTATSSYEGQQVLTTPGIVTAIGNGFFYLQSPDNQADQDSLTSNGIYVASTQAANRKIGDLVQVSGIVYETERRTQIGQGSVQVTLVDTDIPLPSPVILNADFPSGNPQSLPELESLEGMRVQFSGLATGPSDFRSMIPVVARTERPFREPGIKFPGKASLPVWDGNPEIFWLLPNALGAPNNRFIIAGTPISATGLLSQSGSEYILMPEVYQLGASPAPVAVRPARENEFTIASLNLRRFEENRDDFDQKARKLALFIKEMLHGPDLIALQEVGSNSALSTLRFLIQQLDASLEYTPFFLSGNDDIHLAFLAKDNKFSNIQVEQLGKQETMPGGGILFDRPPLLFSATLANQTGVGLKVLNIHLRSLLGIEGSNESFVREKRYRQAVAVATIAEDLQNDNLLILGDFNAFPFSDGYVDVVNQISGMESLGAEYPPEPIVVPALQNLADILPAEERYSFVFEGSAQQIDHALAGPLQGLQVNDMIFARANADFPDAFAPNEQIVQRASDHDSFVIYLLPDQPNAVETALSGGETKLFPNPARVGEKIFLTLPGDVRAHIHLVSINGQTIHQSIKQKGEANVNIAIKQSGSYFLFIQSDESFHSEKIVVLPSN